MMPAKNPGNRFAAFQESAVIAGVLMLVVGVAAVMLGFGTRKPKSADPVAYARCQARVAWGFRIGLSATMALAILCTSNHSFGDGLSGEEQLKQALGHAAPRGKRSWWRAEHLGPRSAAVATTSLACAVLAGGLTWAFCGRIAPAFGATLLFWLVLGALAAVTTEFPYVDLFDFPYGLHYRLALASLEDNPLTLGEYMRARDPFTGDLEVDSRAALVRSAVEEGLPDIPAASLSILSGWDQADYPPRVWWEAEAKRLSASNAARKAELDSAFQRDLERAREAKIACPECGGTGEQWHESQRACPQCGGSGGRVQRREHVVTKTRYYIGDDGLPHVGGYEYGDVTTRVPCPACGGTGAGASFRGFLPCWKCKGERIVLPSPPPSPEEIAAESRRLFDDMIAAQWGATESWPDPRSQANRAFEEFLRQSCPKGWERIADYSAYCNSCSSRGCPTLANNDFHDRVTAASKTRAVAAAKVFLASTDPNRDAAYSNYEQWCRANSAYVLLRRDFDRAVDCARNPVARGAVPCDACRGTGTRQRAERCAICRGSGLNSMRRVSDPVACPACSGKCYRVVSGECGKCHATGQVVVEKPNEMDVEKIGIPA